jgi:Ca2+/Na+ antiporter
LEKKYSKLVHADNDSDAELDDLYLKTLVFYFIVFLILVFLHCYFFIRKMKFINQMHNLNLALSQDERQCLEQRLFHIIV